MQKSCSGDGDVDVFGGMWGGLAFALLLPEARTGSIRLSDLYRLNFESLVGQRLADLCQRQVHRTTKDLDGGLTPV